MKTYKTGLAGGLAALTLAGCVAIDATDVQLDAAPTMSAAEAAALVQARNDDFEALFAAKDAAGLASQMYAKDGRIVPPDAPDQVGHEAIAAYWTGAMTVLGSVDLKTVEAVPAGETHISERTHVTLYAEDGTAIGGGKAVILWTQEDGVWKMQWDSWNDGPVD